MSPTPIEKASREDLEVATEISHALDKMEFSAVKYNLAIGQKNNAWSSVNYLLIVSFTALKERFPLSLDMPVM